jgi:signal transduction histidine kinase/CheY-like chemotaxis protein
MPGAADCERVLICARGSRDAEITARLLERDGLEALVCADVGGLCAAIDEGAGAALLSEDVLAPAACERLADLLATQPPWSDFPIVVFGRPRTLHDRTSNDRLRALGNVTFLDRPVQVRSMLAAVHAALRGRRRQYAARGAIESRDQFLAMLGHELRNPLAAIHLAGELLTQQATDAQRAKQHAILARQTHHLSRLVDDLLDVARVTYGKVTLRLERVELGEILRSCWQAFEAAAQSQRLRYTLELGARDAFVLGDRDRLEQIFGNLLTNAIKYTPRGGTVRVQLATTDSECVVRVVDSGIGIAADVLPGVFELFRQADRSLARAKGGMGLGLTVVRSLLRLHGGSVEAFSDGPNQGSEFRVSLPLVRRPSETAAPAQRAAAAITPHKVVIVEDNDDLREMQEQLLRFAGHEVHSATSGPSGVAAILDWEPDVAFVDLGLPEFDGYELARRVRARGTSVRLIAVSGYGQVEDRKRAQAAGFDGHLTKPVGLPEMVQSMLLPRSELQAHGRALVTAGRSGSALPCASACPARSTS